MQIIPFDKREGFIWVNGEIVAWPEAKIHILTHGLHYGSCVFEGERVYNKKIFKLKEHSQRLIDSAQLLGFKLPYTLEEIENATKQIVEIQKIENGYIRPFAWRGCGGALTVAATSNPIQVAIACWSWPAHYADRKKDVTLTFSDWVRPAPNSVPVQSKAGGLYMICTMSKHKAMDLGFDDALMLDYRGYVAEATTSNIFLVINDELHTPIADCFLNGITRQVIIEIAQKNKIKVIERHIKPEELKDASEVFLTGTAAEINPVTKIDNDKYEIGKLTTLLIEEYKKLVLNT